MRSIFLVLGLFLFTNNLLAQQVSMACCIVEDPDSSLSATSHFAMLGSDEAFRDKHEIPLPFTLHEKKGKMITFKTEEGKNGQAYFIKSKKKSDNFLLVFHEWWGLNDHIKEEAEKLHKDLEDVNVLAIDLYDGKFADTREKAMKLMQGVEEKRAESIIEGALKFAGKYARIGTIGWCFGGSWSLQTAIIAGSHTVACVMYYGMPEDDVEDLKKLQAPVLGIFAEKDASITPEIVEKFEEDMDEAEEVLEVEMFDADHGFANPSNPKFDEEATEKAYKLAIDFLQDGYEASYE